MISDLLRQIDREGSSPLNQTGMTWDADEQRLQLTEQVSYDRWQFLYDAAAGIPAVLVQRTADQDNTTLGVTVYVREPGGELLASFEPGAGATYYHFDALGSTVLLSDASGNPNGAYAYGAWGDVLAAPGAWQPYQYVGQLGYYTHTPSQGAEVADWLQLGVRFYQPEMGRFERRDPVMGTESAYHYTNGNALASVDPTGYLDIRKLPIIGSLIDRSTEGAYCIHESCYGHSTMGDGGGVRCIPNLSRPDASVPGPKPPRPPQPGEPAPPAGCGRNPYNCQQVDAIDLPKDLDVIIHGVPQRPQSGRAVLKIPNLARCNMICPADNPAGRPDLYCTWQDSKHPVEWEPIKN